MHQANNSTTNSSPKNTLSERKLAANRANSKRSTGPRTPEGKARSAMNALRHGILAKAAFNGTIEGDERRTEFEELLAGLAQEYQPRTMTEIVTVQQLAGCYWKLARVWRFEQESAVKARRLLDGDNEHRHYQTPYDKMMQAERDLLKRAGLHETNIPIGASAATILRYQGSINTMMTRCLALLERRRKERLKEEEAFEGLDYINEATAPEPKREDTEEQPVSSAEDRALHKRTQKAQADATLFSAADAKRPSDEGAERGPNP